MNINRKKVLFENILVYGFGGMIGNIIPYVMLPIITRMMPDTAYFGYSDIVTTIESFASAVMTMGLYDASFRVMFDYDELQERKSVYNSALLLVTILSLVLGIACLCFRNIATILIFGDIRFSVLWVIAIVTSMLRASCNVHNVPLRSQNRKKVYLFINTITPSLPYFIVVPMILKGHYLIALPMAFLISRIVSCIIFFLINFKWINFRWINKMQCKNLLKIGVPLMPSFIIYWIFNSCDRFMILKFMGAEANGVYAVGNRIGHISQLIYQAFSSGWLYFAYATMKDNDQVEMTSKIMEILNLVSCGAAVMMAVMSDVIFSILFVGEYQKGTIVAPYLFFAPLVLMQYQTIASQFMIINKAWACTCVLCLGAVVNVLCNALWIPKLGIEGAAIGTLVGYIVTLAITVVVLLRLKKLFLSRRIIFVWIIFAIFGFVWRIWCYNSLFYKCMAGCVVLILYMILYKDELIGFIAKIRAKCTSISK